MGSELMQGLLTDEKSAHMLVTESATDRAAGEASLDRKEWFGVHVVAYAIGVWNLFAVDLARTPGEWWFWIPAAVWAAALGIHAVWLIWSGKRLAQPPSTISRGEVAR